MTDIQEYMIGTAGLALSFLIMYLSFRKISCIEEDDTLSTSDNNCSHSYHSKYMNNKYYWRDWDGGSNGNPPVNTCSKCFIIKED